MALTDKVAFGEDDLRVDSDGNTVVTNELTTSGLKREAVLTVDMANAAHALVTGTASAGETKLVANLVLVDPNGGAQTLTLPAEADFVGKLFISNSADAAETITVADDGATTIGTLDQGESGIFVCDGAGWVGFVGANT